MKDYSLSQLPPKIRFWAKVIKSESCWQWLGDVVPNKSTPYGRMYWEGKTRLAHIVSWFVHYGEWPDRLVLHECDNSLCVNPYHLYLGTAKQNMKDRQARNRTAKGERNGHAVLSQTQVLEIRSKYTEEDNFELIGSEYVVTGRTISNIINRKTWNHI